MSRYYRLEGKSAVPCELMEWAKAFEGTRHVARETINGVEISTVFLGLDHSWEPGGPPILFETMIFGGPHDQYQERCSTWEQAEAMHAEAVKLVKGDQDAEEELKMQMMTEQTERK